jgi:hypothetical protein
LTALCPGGGPSGPRPNLQQIQSFLGGAIADALEAKQLGWAAALSAGLGAITIDINTTCATDPPAIPSFTPQRIASYYNLLDPNSYTNFFNDFSDLLKHYLWWDFCQCTGGSTPPAPTPVPAPTGWQIDNPKLTQPPTGTPCGGDLTRGTTITWDPAGNFADDFAQNYNPTSFPTYTWLNAAADTDQPADFPVLFTLEWRAAQGSPVLGTATIEMPAQDAVLGTSRTPVFPAPGSTGFSWRGHRSGAGPASSQVSLRMTPFCGAPPTSTMQPCCPPDPKLENLIVQVLRLEQLILEGLGGSTAYVRGTPHFSLQGTGTLTVSSLRGIAVDVTAGIPARIQIPGNPPYQWDLGFLSFSDGGGMLQQIRITREHQIMLPPHMDLTTHVGYFLFPGVAITATELNPA